MVEDGRVGREAGDREFVDVAAQCSTRKEPARDVVKPEALAEVMQMLSRCHFLFPRTCQCFARMEYDGRFARVVVMLSD